MINETSPTTDAMRGYRYKHGDRPLDGYTIQRAAGRGGFGEVYYAISDSGREVALKVVHTFEQMELRGISQCMNLKSPHLVSIFDVRTGQRKWIFHTIPYPGEVGYETWPARGTWPHWPKP